MNSEYTVHKSKICPPKSTNAGQKKKKKRRKTKNFENADARFISIQKLTI